MLSHTLCSQFNSFFFVFNLRFSILWTCFLFFFLSFFVCFVFVFVFLLQYFIILHVHVEPSGIILHTVFIYSFFSLMWDHETTVNNFTFKSFLMNISNLWHSLLLQDNWLHKLTELLFFQLSNQCQSFYIWIIFNKHIKFMMQPLNVSWHSVY